MGGVGRVGVVFLEGRGSGSGRCRAFPQPVDRRVDLQAFAHLWDGWRNREGGLSLRDTWWQHPIWIHHVEVVARALDCLVLQGGSLVVHDAVAHVELAVVRLLHILVLVGLLMLLQVRLELVLMLRQRQDHHAGDVTRRGPQGQVCRDDWRAYWRHVLRAGVDEVLVPLPLPASPARLATRLHGCGFRRGQGGEVQVVLVCLNQHLCIGRQSPIVHQRGEDGLGVTVFGLSLKQPRQLGDAVHGSASGVEVVAVLLLAAGHLDVAPPVVAHTVHDDAGEDGAHGEG